MHFLPSALPLLVLTQITEVSVQPHTSPAVGSKIQLQCSFTGNQLLLQQITWSRIYANGTTSFVYEYDACVGSSKAYNELAGRATLSVLKPMESEDNNQIGVLGSARRLPRDVRKALVALTGSTDKTSIADDDDELFLDMFGEIRDKRDIHSALKEYGGSLSRRYFGKEQKDNNNKVSVLRSHRD